MLTKAEIEGCRNLLEKLDYPDLVSLVDTVTNRGISVTKKTEAIKVIITYTNSPAELLKRKKIRRDILVAYLTDYLYEKNEVGFKLPSGKKDLVLEILKRWGTDVEHFELMEIDDNSRDSDSFNTSSEKSFEASPPCQHDTHVTVHQFINITNVNVNSFPDPTKIDGFNVKEFGEQFAKWFYENLNSFCPTLQKPNGDFGPHHFWDDCRLVIQTWSPGPSREVLLDPLSISDKLLMFPKNEQMIFNPNLTQEGIFVKSSAHGLVEILVCGTVHRENNCLGLFQQLFGMVKDPRYNDNWKIKMSRLFLKAMQLLTHMPKLEGNPEEQILAMCKD
ncbi:hypothetical protein ACF0H5_013002 [Mactra antiquata]